MGRFVCPSGTSREQRLVTCAYAVPTSTQVLGRSGPQYASAIGQAYRKFKGQLTRTLGKEAMSVHGISSLRAALAAGVFQLPSGGSSSGGGLARRASQASGSAFGPAAILSGPVQNFAPAEYGALGGLLGGANAATGPSAADEKRADVLGSVAEKISRGDTQGAREQAEALLSKRGDDSEAIRLIATSYLFENDYKNAERRFAQAAALSPDIPSYQDDVSFVRTLNGSDEDVLALARRKMKSSSQRTEGLRLLKHLSDRSPDNADAYLAMAEGFDAAGQPAQVLGALQEAFRLADGTQVDEVVTRARKLADEHPVVGLPRNLLGRALQKAGRLDDAVLELKSASDIAPYNIAYAKDLAGGYAARALNRLEAGKTSDAVMDVRAARAIAPFDAAVTDATARVATKEAKQDITRGNFKRALTKLSVASRKTPDDAKFRKELSGLYLQLGRRFESDSDDKLALASYSKAYELDSTSTTAQTKKAELSYSQGLVEVNANNYDRAITLFESAYNTYRIDDSYGQELAKAYDLRGLQNVALKNYDLAIKDFERGITVDPANTSLGPNYAAALALKAAA